MNQPVSPSRKRVFPATREQIMKGATSRKRGHPQTDPEVWKAEFVKQLHELRSISAAADAVGYSRRHVYRVRGEDPEFAAAWDEAWERVVDQLEQSMMSHAVDGYTKPVFQGGVEVGQVTEFNANERIFLLKKNRTGKYEDRIQVSVTADDYAKSVREALEAQDKEAAAAVESPDAPPAMPAAE